MPNEKKMVYRVLPPRMPPLTQDQMTDFQKKTVAEMIASPRGKVEGPYWAVMRSPGLTDVMRKAGEYFRFNCKLDKRLSELAILMVARAWTQQFVWNWHRGVAVQAGVKESTVSAIGEGRRPQELADDEAIAYDFLHEALTNKSVSDATYARALGLLGESGVMDLLGVTGYYSMLSTVLNVARVPLDGDAPLPLMPMPAQLGI